MLDCSSQGHITACLQDALSEIDHPEAKEVAEQAPWNMSPKDKGFYRALVIYNKKALLTLAKLITGKK